MRFAPPMYSTRSREYALPTYSPPALNWERWLASVQGAVLFVAFVGVWTAVFLLALR